MKKGLFLLFLFVAPAILKAQDTTIIQTLNFSDINKRRGLYVFPDTSFNWRKIIMSYTLKCDAATTWDSYPCGEWDYLTYAFIHQHTGNFDSTATTHPLFKKGTLAPDSCTLMASPVFDYYSDYQYQIVYDAINSETDFSVGSGSAGSNYPFNTDKTIQRVQYLYKTAELTASGLTAGTIDRLRFDVAAVGDAYDRIIIRMKQTSATVLNSFDNGAAWVTVYEGPLSFVSTGLNSVDFTSPFTWNGSLNILVEFSYERNSTGINSVVNAETQSYNAGVISDTASKKYLEFTGNKYVDVNSGGFSTVSDEITVSFWMYGDPASQPENGTIFEGVNSSNTRVINSHLPWSNGRVYWDAGVDAEGFYDRIDKAANTSDYEGKWNHWAFTKNATTGNMKIYLNGVLWHSGTGKTKTMEGVDIFHLGGNAAGTYGYHGKMDEFCVFNKELSASDISSWMYKHITASHPFYGNLLYYFSFEENGGPAAVNEVNASLPASLIGMPVRRNYEASELLQFEQLTTERPNTVFVRGDYSSHFDSTLVTDSVMHEETSLLFFQVSGNDAVPYDTLYGWEPSYSYEYLNGNLIDSTFAGGGTLNINDTLNFYDDPFEIIEPVEIGRFITPYGINLSLGPDGFEWRYDITDYAKLLHDTVDLSAGNTQELIDLKFIMIEGTPPADVIQIDQLWNKGVASYSYANLDNDVNLKADTITLNNNASEFKLKTRLTGHGHNSNDGNYPHCCEWKDNTHYLFANGNQIADWHIWQDDCAENPVFPQGGTWSGQREGWCPGDVVEENEFIVTPFVQGGQIILDYDITPVPASNLGMGGGNYVTAMHLVEYGSPNFSLDAEIYDVIRPNDWGYQSRKNPICYGPKIILRNNGSTALTSCTITYSVSGGPVETYSWTGNLSFLEEEEITLTVSSGSFWVGDGSDIFIAAVSNPNGASDLNPDNDIYKTHFLLPDMYADNFVVNYKTNNYPNENTWTIKDVYGNVVASRSGGVANTVYNDTLNLNPGCYTFEMTDNGEDGLSYWANSAQGSGYLRFRSKTSSTLLKNFTTDFGKSIHYAFFIGNIMYIQETGTDAFAEAFPNPTEGRVMIHISGFTGMVNLEIFDQAGKRIYNSDFNSDETRDLPVDLSGLSNGIYFYSLSSEANYFSGKLVFQK